MSRNAKTGLVLAAVALVFFLAIIAKYWLLR
ncbi:MAG: cytochrome oxidase small assembly protein [Betaproteobacteria bacterium]